MQKATSTPQGLGQVVASLRKHQKTDPCAVEEGLKAIPEQLQEALREKLAQEPRRAQQARARQEAESPEEKWKRLLQHRQRLRRPEDKPEDAEEEENEERLYQKRLAEDRGRLRKSSSQSAQRR